MKSLRYFGGTNVTMMKVMPTACYSELTAHHLRAGTRKESGSGTSSNSSSRSPP